MKITKPDITFSLLFSNDSHGTESTLGNPHESDAAHSLNDGQK